MSRIAPVDPKKTDAATEATLKAVESRLGMLPNMFTTFAHSPAALTGYMQLAENLNRGQLTARQRELVAIAVAQENACEYCLSAHAAIGKGAGLSEADIEKARYGGAGDVLDNAVIDFALQVVRSRADISDSALEAARQAGLANGLMVEVIAHVALNVLTNYVNRIAGTDIDFPLLSLSSAA